MKQLIKYIFSTAILLMIVSGIAFGQKVMTLEQCREQAVEFNKELKNAALQNKEAKVNQETARTAYLPVLSGSVTGLYVPKKFDYSFGGSFLPTAESAEAAQAGDYTGLSDVWMPEVGLNMDNITLFNGGLSLDQPVYAGGKIRNINKQADAGVNIAGYALNLKYSQVIENTDNAFWNVAMVQENIKIAEEYIKMLTEFEDQMSAMYEVGLQPASEKLKISVKKNEAELKLIKAKNGLKIAKMYLNQTLGQPLETDIQIKYDTLSNVKLFSMDNGAELAANNRSELKILEQQKEISEYSKKITQADYLPTVGVSAKYSSTWVNELHEDFEFVPILAAKVSIPIFQWGQGAKKQRAAQLKIEQAQTELEHTNDLINLEVLKVKTQVEEAYQSVLLAKKNVAEAEESLSETRASFDVGLNTTTEMLNVQAQWQEAKAQLTNSIAQYRVLKTTWERVTGNLYMSKEEK